VASAVAGLPEYTAEDAALFGNTLSPTVFGMTPDRPLAADPKLPARVKEADFVARMRISTVTREVLAGRELHSLRLVLEGRPLRGALRSGEEILDLTVPSGSPAAARLESRRGALAGRRVITFVRQFQDGGEPVLRWHAEGDTPELRSLVLAAKPLDGPPQATQTAP